MISPRDSTKQNPYSAPTAPLEQPAVDSGARRRLFAFCVVFYLLIAVEGSNAFAFRVGNDRALLDLLLSFGAAICLGNWVLADARARRQPIARSKSTWVIVFAWFAAPIHLIATRGWKGLLWVVVHAFLVISVFAASGFISSVASYGWPW